MTSPSTRTAHRLAALAFAALLGTVSVACSSDGSEGAAPTTTAPPEDGGDAGGPTDDEEAAHRAAVEAATEADYVAAFEASLAVGDSEVFTAEQVSCLSERWVTVLSVERLKEADIAPDDLTSDLGDFTDLDLDEATARAMAEGFPTCDMSLRDVFLGSLNANLSEEGRACVEEALTSDALEDSFVAGLIGEEVENDPLVAAQACFS